MRGNERFQQEMLEVGSLEKRVSAAHPLRRMRAMTDEALAALGPELDAMYSTTGRPSIPPEQMLRALLLQMLYTVRSERRLVEQMEHDMLFRWFIGLDWNSACGTQAAFRRTAIHRSPRRHPTFHFKHPLFQHPLKAWPTWKHGA